MRESFRERERERNLKLVEYFVFAVVRRIQLHWRVAQSSGHASDDIQVAHVAVQVTASRQTRDTQTGTQTPIEIVFTIIHTVHTVHTHAQPQLHIHT